MALSHAGPWFAFFFAKIESMAGARAEPSARRGIIASRQQKVHRMTLLSRACGSQIFWDCGEPLPHWCVLGLRDGPRPPPHPLKVRPLEPRRNCTGALRFRASPPSKPFPPALSLLYRQVPLSHCPPNCHRLCHPIVRDRWQSGGIRPDEKPRHR
jgi:hypothetical protein